MASSNTETARVREASRRKVEPEIVSEFAQGIVGLFNELEEDEYVRIHWTPYVDGTPMPQQAARLEYSEELRTVHPQQWILNLARQHQWSGGHGLLRVIVRQLKTGEHRVERSWGVYMPNFEPIEEDEFEEGLLENLETFIEQAGAVFQRVEPHIDPMIKRGKTFIQFYWRQMKETPAAGSPKTDPSGEEPSKNGPEPDPAAESDAHEHSPAEARGSSDQGGSSPEGSVAPDAHETLAAMFGAEIGAELAQHLDKLINDDDDDQEEDEEDEEDETNPPGMQLVPFTDSEVLPPK